MPKSSSEAGRLLRKQGYLVPNHVAYERAKAADTPGAARNRRAAEGPKAPTPVATPKLIGPDIISGDPDIYPAWTGSRDKNVTPPDTTGAIGPSRYIQLVNDKYGIYDRTGNVISSGELQTFAQANTADVTDPQVIWDSGTNRFYFAILDFSGSVGDGPDNNLYIGYSRRATPSAAGLSEWCVYVFPYGSALPDYPKLGDSSAFWLIGSNVFNPNYVGSDVAWISKPPGGTDCAVLNGGDLPGPLLLDDATQAFTPVPANQVDTNDTGYVVATPDASDGKPHAFIDTYAVTKAVDGSALFAAPVRHDVSSYTMPPSAPQSGTASVLDTLDGRLTTAVVAFDPSMGATALWTEHTVAGGAGSAVSWYEFAPAVDSPIRSGALTDATLYTFNAAISPDRRVSGRTSEFGDAFVIGFDTSSASDHVRIQMVSQWSNYPMSEFVEVKASPGFNDDFSCPAPTGCRWGDYSGASPDPAANPFSNHGQVWLGNQWNVASANSNDVDWRTYVWGTHPVPYVILTGPAGVFQKGTKLGVSWSLGNQASATDVQYRQAPYNGTFGPPILWQNQVPAGGAVFGGDPGNTYCFSAQSYDDTPSGPRPWGFAGERCAVVPLDDRALGGRGWSRLNGKGFFLNTFSQTSAVGRSLIKSGISAKRVQMMVETCPTCGSIKIYWNNVLTHAYSLHASGTHKLVYLSAVSFGSVQSGTIKIVVSSSGKPVIIDALAVSAV